MSAIMATRYLLESNKIHFKLENKLSSISSLLQYALNPVAHHIENMSQLGTRDPVSASGRR